MEPVGPQVVQQGAPYRQWLPRKTVKRAGRRLISKLCQSDERYLLTLQLLILIAGKGKLQLGESEVRKQIEVTTVLKSIGFIAWGGLSLINCYRLETLFSLYEKQVIAAADFYQLDYLKDALENKAESAVR